MNEDYDIKRRLHLVSSHEQGDEDRERLEREHPSVHIVYIANCTLHMCTLCTTHSQSGKRRKSGATLILLLTDTNL